MAWTCGCCQAVLNLDKVDVDSKSEEGRTPLSYAAEYGNEAIVKILRDNV
jgi:ankyrin repeat protein